MRHVAGYLFLASIVALAATRAVAATAGPDAFGYFWCDSDEPGVDSTFPAFLPSDLRALGYSGDESLVALDLPPSVFPTGFEFYGVRYTTVWLSSNGWLSFIDPLGNTHPLSAAMPNPAMPNATLAFLWNDLTLEVTAPEATAGPNLALDGFTIELLAARSADPSQSVQIDITLWTDMRIKVVYNGAASSILGSPTQIGLEDHRGSVGIAYMSSGMPLYGARFRSDYAVLFHQGFDCSTPLCGANPVPPAVGGALRATVDGGEIELTWPGAETTDMSAHRVYRDADPALPEVSREPVATVPLGAERVTDPDPGAGTVFYQLVGLSCEGDLVGPY